MHSCARNLNGFALRAVIDYSGLVYCNERG